MANLNSFAFDYFVRSSLAGINLSDYIFKQLPILPPDSYEAVPILKNIIQQRVLELTFTAWDLQSFADDLGYTGSPFGWNEERRHLIRSEMDAAFFHLYDINRMDTEYILETFTIIKRRDEQAHGEYSTKRDILKIYDRMASSFETGKPYKSDLT